MKKVGIITINDFDNYGNRLQCYAVQNYLQKYDLDVENIYNSGKSLNKLILFKLKKYAKFILKHNNERYILKRNSKFKKFNKCIKFSKFKIINGKENNNINDKYDYFIVGSDQVWNPNFKANSKADFLYFAEDKKKIAFSASFGISKLPEEKKADFKKYLSEFKAISVREDAGKKIIEDLTGRKDIEVLIDPTMLLKSDEWDKVNSRPKQLDQLKNKQYILNYFLGEIEKEWKEEIDRIAIENNCEVINLLDKKSPFYQTGPSEFLYLEKNAFLVCTDSFHSSVFSIIYNRPFIVFNRTGKDEKKKMNSRIDTLLSKFNLQKRRFEGKITEENLKHDYTEAYKILENEKQKSMTFLKKALDIK